MTLPQEPRRIRVLVADDAATIRKLLVRALDGDDRIQVVGEACDGAEAVQKARELRPDVITMDMSMPRMDGLRAISEIMSDYPTRILVVCSVERERQVDLTFQAVAAGALELIAKPSGHTGSNVRAWMDRVAESVVLMSQVPVVTHKRLETPGADAGRSRRRAIEAFGIAASAGGPAALAHLLRELPRDLPAPVLIAQHMPSGFTSGLCRWLERVSPLGVAIAVGGMRPAPGRVYLAPDGHHLEVGPDRNFVVSTAGSEVCPSGDRLLFSLGRTFQDRACGIVLTGMGEDGAMGLMEIRRAGGVTLAQNQETSVVFGMPRAALEAGSTDTLLPLHAIASFMAEVCAGRAMDRRPGGNG